MFLKMVHASIIPNNIRTVQFINILTKVILIIEESKCNIKYHFGTYPYLQRSIL